MALLKFKSNVVVPKTVIIAMAGINAANELLMPDTMYVTSGNDSVHMKGSKHYEDKALDFRTKHLSTVKKAAWIAEFKKRLGPEYQFIFEDAGKDNEHLHVEFDPK